MIDSVQSPETPATWPLEGIRVVEYASYVTGPYASVLLADLGADVIKVEDRDGGDPFRGWGEDGYSATFRSLNRGKRSLALDLKAAEARRIVLELIDRGDVFIENFRPGVAERRGFGYEAIRSRNPGIVYCSISGFGKDGPYRDRPGYDTVGQALSGLLGLLTDFDRPRPVGISLSDHITGIFACHGIMAALIRKARTGEGCLVETSLLQATTAFLAENAARYFDEGIVPDRAARTRIAQAYAFVAGDGKPFAVHLSSPPKFWHGLIEATGHPELGEDPRFADRQARIANYDALAAVLGEIFATAPRAVWLQRLAEHDVPSAPVNRLDEVFEDPGVEALDLVQTLVHPRMGPMRLLAGGVTVGRRAPRDPPSPPPLLGEHTAEILAELGYSSDSIADLRARRTI